MERKLVFFTFDILYTIASPSLSYSSQYKRLPSNISIIFSENLSETIQLVDHGWSHLSYSKSHQIVCLCERLNEEKKYLERIFQYVLNEVRVCVCAYA